MGVVLGDNSYGKSGIRLVRVVRAGDRHELTDLTVDVALAGDLADTHRTGDNAKVLPTDTQKNTVYAFAREYGVDGPEAFGLRLARHFVDSQPAITRSRVTLAAHGWSRLGGHTFTPAAGGTRTAEVTYDGVRAEVVAGVRDLVLLNTTGSRFAGFVRDRYTTLAEADDRILATRVEATWRHAGSDVDWDDSHRRATEALVGAFRATDSDSLQQTLYELGGAVLAACPELTEVRLSLPNLHHFLVDLAPFGLDNPNEVFWAADRPYGLIEGTVRREPDPA
jgi:urate oxidase